MRRPSHLDPTQVADLAWLDRPQMVEVDRVMTGELGITLIQMMEHAGRHLAALLRDRFLGGDATDRQVVVLAGTGGNGGGGLVAARRLHNWGADVRIVTTSAPAGYGTVPAEQLRIAQRLGIPVSGQPGGAAHDAVIIDALVGYTLAGPLRDRVAALTAWAMQQPAPVLSLDLPTGLDATTGAVLGPVMQPAATLTLAMPKVGLRADTATPELYLADIGVPPFVYEPIVGRPVATPFTRSDLVQVR